MICITSCAKVCIVDVDDVQVETPWLRPTK